MNGRIFIFGWTKPLNLATEFVLTITSALWSLRWAGDVIREFIFWGTGGTDHYSNSVRDRIYRCCWLRTSHPTALHWRLLHDNRLIILFNTIGCISKIHHMVSIINNKLGKAKLKHHVTFWPVDAWQKQDPAWFVNPFSLFCCLLIITRFEIWS